MPEPIRIELPVSRETLARLAAGDEVRLSGPVYTARDAGHARLLAALAETGELPFGLAGQTLFYAGPTPRGRRTTRRLGRPHHRQAHGRRDAARCCARASSRPSARARAPTRSAPRSPRPAASTSPPWAAPPRCSARTWSRPKPVAWPELGTEALVRLTLSRLPRVRRHRRDGEDLYADRAGRVASGDRRRAVSERGVFVTFEGGEGCGKSTQLKLLARGSRPLGVAVRALREPGGTAVGEAVRAILLDPEHAGLDDTAEILLYEAARAQLVAEVIEPALEAGEVVLCDRFYDSTTAYQGYARGHPARPRRRAQPRARPAAWRRTAPSCSTSTPELGITRATSQGADRLESEDLAFHERVRAASSPSPPQSRTACGSWTLRATSTRSPSGSRRRSPTCRSSLMRSAALDDPLRLRRPRRPGARGELHARRGRERARQPRVPVRGASGLRQGDGGQVAGVRASCATTTDAARAATATAYAEAPTRTST